MDDCRSILSFNACLTCCKHWSHIWLIANSFPQFHNDESSESRSYFTTDCDGIHTNRRISPLWPRTRLALWIGIMAGMSECDFPTFLCKFYASYFIPRKVWILSMD
eukprot:Pompholyxophrys_punicea_v1_NODE_131_length_3293_cov_4.448734.p3 type:complete len:106 gc:universal NODE_131_length_3293_cov_4.448734:1235-918(-)